MPSRGIVHLYRVVPNENGAGGERGVSDGFVIDPEHIPSTDGIVQLTLSVLQSAGDAATLRVRFGGTLGATTPDGTIAFTTSTTGTGTFAHTANATAPLTTGLVRLTSDNGTTVTIKAFTLALRNPA